MKRFFKVVAVVQAALLILAGCGAGGGTEAATEDSSEANVAEEAVTEEATVEPQEPETEAEADTEDSDLAEFDMLEYEDPSSLPPYTYQGTEDYLDVISAYLIDYARKDLGMDTANVIIPYGIIVQTDDKDPEDTIAYGIYSIDGYDLYNTTLENTTGSMSYGAFHLKKKDDGTFEVKKADLALMDEDAIDLFAPVEGLYEKVIAVSDEKLLEARETAIAEYINTNGLNITQWQDFSHDPVSVLNAPETPDEAQHYTYKSPLGYQITYDLREFSLLPSETDDMYSKIKDENTATLMVIKKGEGKDADESISKVLSDFDGGNSEIVDDKIGGIACRRAEHDEKIEDGRIFRYVCYAVPAKDGVLTVLLEATVKDDASGMSAEELEKIFNGMLSTFAITSGAEAGAPYFTKGVYVNYGKEEKVPDKTFFYVFRSETEGVTDDGTTGMGLPFAAATYLKNNK